MMRTSFKKTIVLLLLLPSLAAQAGEDDRLLAELVTCQQAANTQARSTALKVLQARSTSDGNGSQNIQGRIQVGDLCIENAQVSGAFGTFLASGNVCDGDPAPLIDFLKRSQSGLQPAALSSDPNMVAAFEAPKYSIALYHGEPGFRPGLPDPASKRLSFICGYQGSGPQ